MNIKINNNYSLKSDKYNIILVKKVLDDNGDVVVNKDGKESETHVGYDSDVSKALDALVDYEIKTATIESFEELKRKYTELKDIVSEINEKLSDN